MADNLTVEQRRKNMQHIKILVMTKWINCVFVRYMGENSER